jgi:dipeptidyl aminopeptidase/acylaminoacyl peptidase
MRMWRRNSFRKILAAAALTGCWLLPASFGQEGTREQVIDAWLALGPFLEPWPAFHSDKQKGFGAEDLLKFEEIDITSLRPKAGRSLQWLDGTAVAWKEIKTGEKGVGLTAQPAALSTAYLGAYIEVSRWIRTRITVTSLQLIQVYLDGKLIATKSKADKPEKTGATNGEGKVAADAKLETGKHVFIIKTVYDPEFRTDWRVKASFEIAEKYASPGLQFSLLPEGRITLRHLFDSPKPAGISISPDGTLVALTISQSLPPSDDSESWLELYEVQSGRLVQTYRGGQTVSNVNWAPAGKKFTYVIYDKSGGSIWLADLEAGTSTPLLRNIKNLGSHTWSPDGTFLVFSVTEEGEKDSDNAKRYQTLEDRQPGWRNRSYLYKLTLTDRLRRKLTAGELSTNLNAVSPDGTKFLFSRTVVDYAERPYSKTELYFLDLATLKEELVWKGKWFTRAEWSPDGKKLLFLGGPSLFGVLGVNVAKGLVPNEYDTQAYLYDIAAKRAEAITRDFDPSISQAFWVNPGDTIYFTTTDRSFAHIYEYSLKRKAFALIESGVESVDQIDVAQTKPVGAFIGSGSTAPAKAYLLDLNKKEARLLRDPSKNEYADVRFGRVEPWSFKNKKGTEIEGYIFYPPDFDPAKKYPCIVNYYGGTTPTTRNFGERYPKSYYAALGYVVYVLQPSGAIGFGQNFSALHVNDWGTIIADEIIDGVKKFLLAHPFVESKRVGCIGASYGGFMTMLILTRTNIFASAIAHAGISSISSYWGEGYWGYSYSAVATADSFPWNRKDIYVNQSPLFNADKIKTPLLLLHGAVDTNVPPGESAQLFTALKLLGREVEYIQFFDQNHQILTYNKKILWTKTIMAWFDRWLKGQPEWWSDLYANK